jgi:hypothetical protein
MSDEPTALQMWSARQGVVISGIAVDQYHRSELDQARAMCEIVERVTAERDRARDLAVRAGAFDGCASCDQVTAEFGRLIEERDQALYERDAAMRLYELDRESVEFARGLIPTQLGDSDGR